MGKRVLLILTIVMMAFGYVSADEDEMCVPMGDITLKALVEDAKRSEVTFPHAVHFSYSCQQCHHKWDNEEPIVGCTTSGCHDLAENPDTDDQLLKARYYKEAFHSMCIGCHKEIKAQNRAIEAAPLGADKTISPTGPTGCIQCHPKD